jgi:ureidoglycolate hydrolase
MTGEKSIPSTLLEIGEWPDEGFRPIINIGEYRLAVLKYFSGVSAGNINRIERHNLTDEIFILTEGSARLILLETFPEKNGTHVLQMRRNAAYNVRAGVWHHVILSKDATVLIFERADTSRENSEYFMPDAALVKRIRDELESA